MTNTFIPLMLFALVVSIFSLPGTPACAAGQWTEIGRQNVTRFISAEVFNGKIYGGTHCAPKSEIYDYPPFRKPQFFGGESVFDLCAFGGSLYSTHEDGGKIYRLVGDQWQLAHNHPGWDYTWTMVVFKGSLYCTGGTVSTVGLLRTVDGSKWDFVVNLPEFAWIPAVYRGELYLAGHGGTAYASEPACVFKSSDGDTFTKVTALTGEPEYMCAYVWQDRLYLGTGGWTNNRSSNDSAKIYRYDGSTRTEVLTVAMNAVTSICATGGKLYATVDSGWERESGDSRVYESSDGVNWTLIKTFSGIPEMRLMSGRSDSELIAFGGKACAYGVMYSYILDPVSEWKSYVDKTRNFALLYPGNTRPKDRSAEMKPKGAGSFWVEFSGPSKKASYVINVRHITLPAQSTPEDYAKSNKFLLAWKRAEINGIGGFVTTTGSAAKKDVAHRAVLVDGKSVWMLNLTDSSGGDPLVTGRIFDHTLRSLNTSGWKPFQ